MKQGQIAHLDRDPQNDCLDNLAFLCLSHHDQYDTRTSQSKGWTIAEVVHYRVLLYRKVEILRGTLIEDDQLEVEDPQLENAREYHYFVAHEFSPKKKDDLRDAIERAFRGTGLNAYYADLEVRQSHILEKIRDMISETHFGIYDISNPSKPNVFLELGIAMAAEKPCYIICEEEKHSEVPTGLKGLDIVCYESNRQLTEKLADLVVKWEVTRHRIRQERDVYSEDEILRDPVRIYQAEGKEMHHAFGIENPDKDAGNQKAWYGDSSIPCPVHLMYGPYYDLPKPGAYKAVFKVKIDKTTGFREVLYIDVISNKNPGLNSHRAIRSIQFKQPNVYQFFGVEFEYQAETDVEYRVIKLLQARRIWIDYVVVIRQPD